MKLEQDHLTTPHTLTQYKSVYKRAIELGIAYTNNENRYGWSDAEWERYRRRWPNLSYSKSLGSTNKPPLIRGNNNIIKQQYKPISVSRFMALMEGNEIPKGKITLIHRLV